MSQPESQPETRWTYTTLELVASRGAGSFAAWDILEALADAGLLLPPGGARREEWGIRSIDSPVIRVVPERGVGAFKPRYRRTSWSWAVEGELNDNWPCYTGPWTEVPQ